MSDTLSASELDALDAPNEDSQIGTSEPRLSLELRDTIGVQPDDPLAEAGRRVLRYHFERMLLHEPGTRQGIDIEALHDMRVATRRMRSAFRLFKPAFCAKAIRPFRKELRNIAGTLGVVRDLDVALDRLSRYTETHSDTDLGALRVQWNAQLLEARAALIVELDSPRFARFVARFDRFLQEPGAGARPLPPSDEPTPYQVRHVIPPLVAEQFASVRAYETIIPGASIARLHALRIEFKRLRYTLEFFEDVLGGEVKRVIKGIKGMQDHLGDLHDADVAVSEITAMIDQQEETYSGKPSYARPTLDGVYEYLAAQVHERQRLLESFPDTWTRFIGQNVRRDLALAVAAL